MSQLSFDVIKRVWPKSGLVTLFKKYSRIVVANFDCLSESFRIEGQMCASTVVPGLRALCLSP